MSTEVALASAEPGGDDEYQAFYAVLAATARGRAFLDEHARRTRHAETDVLLAALKRLENQVRAQTPVPPPASPVLAEVGAVLEAVRRARAQIDAVQLSAAVTQLVSALDTVQRRLSALLPEAAPVEAPAPPPVQQPFALAITAVAAQALAAAEGEDEAVKVIKAGSIPPAPVFAGDDFSARGDLGPAEAEVAESAAELELPVPPAPLQTEDDAMDALMALSEEERLALFS